MARKKKDDTGEAQQIVKVPTVPDVYLHPLDLGFVGPLTDETFPVARSAWQDAKAEVTRRKKLFEEVKKPLNEARNKVLELEKLSVGYAQTRVDVLGKLIQQYQDALERLRMEAARKQREEDERKAREERERQLAALKAAEAAAPQQHKAIIQEQAAALATAPLRVVPTQPAMVPTPVAPLIPQQTRYHAEVTDFPALVMAVAAPLMLQTLGEAFGTDVTVVKSFLARFGSAQIGLLEPCMPELNALAVQCGESLPVPGVVGVGKTTLVNRAASTGFSVPSAPAVVQPARFDKPAADDDFRF